MPSPAGREGEQHVARRLAADRRARLLHHPRDVAVADGGAVERDALARERRLEAEVRHHGADDAARARGCPCRFQSRRDDPEDVVAVEDAAGLVGEDRAVRVAVVRDSDRRAALARRRRAMFSGWSAPQLALMLRPSGASQIAATSRAGAAQAPPARDRRRRRCPRRRRSRARPVARACSAASRSR